VISIVDYGLGNIQAFLNTFRRLNIAAKSVSNAEDLWDAKRIILPGVGHFDNAMTRLEESGMRGILDDLVLRGNVPVLGVCVGMQMLGLSSEEGQRPGLGWVDGRVRSLRRLKLSSSLPLPHMGWNEVQPRSEVPLFEGLEEGGRFYFLHSYYFECHNEGDIAALTEYGESFPCAVRSRNVYGVQFHPEKSHRFGTRLLQNFSTL
jgi:glutamine amidotransferase